MHGMIYIWNHVCNIYIFWKTDDSHLTGAADSSGSISFVFLSFGTCGTSITSSSSWTALISVSIKSSYPSNFVGFESPWGKMAKPQPAFAWVARPLFPASVQR